MKHDEQAYREFLARTSERVRQWPAWKRNVSIYGEKRELFPANTQKPANTTGIAPKEPMIVRILAEASETVAARFREAFGSARTDRVYVLEQALVRLVQALPDCAADGCEQKATWGVTSHDPEWCERHRCQAASGSVPVFVRRAHYADALVEAEAVLRVGRK